MARMTLVSVIRVKTRRMTESCQLIGICFLWLDSRFHQTWQAFAAPRIRLHLGAVCCDQLYIVRASLTVFGSSASCDRSNWTLPMQLPVEMPFGAKPVSRLACTAFTETMSEAGSNLGR